MKIIFFVLLCFVSHFSHTQTMKEIDSISIDMCNYLKTFQHPNDTIRINSFYQNKMNPYLIGLGEEKAEVIGTRLFYRLQRNCGEFRDVLRRIDPPADWNEKNMKKPTSKASKQDVESFKELSNFYYFEATGDTTLVVMKEGNWTDAFADSTFSYLTYEWLSDNEFELKFIRSNNETRSNFSVKGDRYVYQILEKSDNYFVMSVNIPGQKSYDLFKMYFSEQELNKGE